MAIQITNTLTRQKEPFVPLKEGQVRMYICGPTVYGLTHVGNARPNVFFDVVRRFLIFKGYQVTFVSNYTDVDDKIINKAREQKKDSLEISEQYIVEFRKDMDALGIRIPDGTPKVTEHIPQIIKFIEGLVANGSAYVADDGEVFFSVRSFKEYGKLSGRNVDELLVGVRIDANEKKREPADFSLWKPRKQEDEPAWDSPWGKGRPGWHIECSVMATEYLGKTFDIHGGGLDLIHPHHENEIAQAEALTHQPFAKYWMHNNMVTIDSEKMSKSVGNFFLNRDFMNRFGAETLRFLLLSGHYRSPIDFSEQHIKECQGSLHRIYTTLAKCAAFPTAPGTAKPLPDEARISEFAAKFPKEWQEAMEDDFNTAKLMGYVFDYVRLMNGLLDKKGFKPSPDSGKLVTQFLDQMRELSGVLHLFSDEPKAFLAKLKLLMLNDRGMKAEDIEAQIEVRKAARAAKDFKKSDEVRDALLAKGIELRDMPHGTEWDVIP